MPEPLRTAQGARFYELAFEEWAKNGNQFAAANFMMLADLADADANNYGSYYGLGKDQAFKSFLQTLGMFDTKGRPKPGWDVFQKHAN